MENNEKDKKVTEAKTESKTKSKTKSKLTKSQKIMITGFSVVFIAILAVGFFVYSLLNKKPVVDPPYNGGNLVVDESNLGSIGEHLDDQVADGMFEVNMNTIWSFANGKSASSDAYIANSTSNHYPISFDVKLSDSEEAIYTSSVIPVGYSIKEIKLDTDLAAGTYKAICNYHLLNEDGSERSSLAVNITLIIAK